jgi:hypothetical protein
MGLFDFLRPKSLFGHRATDPAEAVRIHAVPVAAWKISLAGARSRETYIFYAFLFGRSAGEVVPRISRELRSEGYEFQEVVGGVLTTPIEEWSSFVLTKFDSIKDALPSAEQMASYNHGVVIYSPKIVRL